MSENQESKVELATEVQPEQTSLENLDVSKLDLSNPDSLPEELKNLKVRLPHKKVIYHLMSNYRLRLANPYGKSMPKESKSWYNGQLLTAEEYSKIPAEDALAYRNQITRSKKRQRS